MTLFQAAQDPDLILKHLVDRHGNVLANGGHFAAYCRAIRVAKIAARVIGTTVEDVVARAQASYASKPNLEK